MNRQTRKGMNFFNINIPVEGIEFNFLFLMMVVFYTGLPGGFFRACAGWMLTPGFGLVHLDNDGNNHRQTRYRIPKRKKNI